MENTKRLFFLRHCKTEFNKNGYISGQKNSPIISKQLYIDEHSIHMPDSLIITSPLERCMTTVHSLISIMGHPKKLLINPNIAERSMGIWEGQARKQIIHDYPDYFNSGEFNPLCTPPNGETFQDFADRISDFERELKNHLLTHNIIVCSHNQALKMLFLIHNNNFTVERWRSLHYNCGGLTEIF